MTIGYINSRPLIAVEAEKPPLTPVSFLLTGADELFNIPIADSEKLTLRSRKELLDIQLEKAWEAFHKEYLLSLRQRDKIWPLRNRLRIGDSVLLQDEDYTSDPRRWRAGKIISIHEPKDTHERSYDVLVNGEVVYKRNYRSLAKLPSFDLIPNHLQEYPLQSLGSGNGNVTNAW